MKTQIFMKKGEANMKERLLRITEINVVLRNHLYENEEEKLALVAEKEELEFQMELAKEM